MPPVEGLTGTVRDGAGRSVPSGRVVLVPAARVAALRETTFDLSLSPEAVVGASWDEPLEDIIRAAPPDLLSAPVDALGEYRFESVPQGSFFPVFMPDEGDLAHLPGGDSARTPRTSEMLRGTRLDLAVSSAAPPNARYVGSTPCLTCHGRHTSLASAHALTLRVPRQGSPYQDISRAPRIEEALAAFDLGTTLYFFDCAAPTGDIGACSVRPEPPSDPGRIGLVVRLLRESTIPTGQVGAYAVELGLTDTGPWVRRPLVLTLGGSLSYQQFITRAALPGGGFTYLVLPFSYQLAGDDTRAAPRDFRWVAYRAQDWLDLPAGTLRQPDYEQAFDRQCAGCHVTGFRLSGSASDGFQAHAAVDPNGLFDLDGDGLREALGVGCESCHGPGSLHLEENPRGASIVSPAKLTPERQNMLCGTCHSDPRGHGGERAPLNAQGHMPLPGVGRRDVAASHVTRMDADADALFPSGDSRFPQQQYTDFVRSEKYRSENILVVCSDCHDPHRSEARNFDLTFDSQDDAACASCHREQSDIHAHASAAVGYDHVGGVDQDALSCVRCHMAKTAQGGARVPGITDLTPISSPVPYFQGDRSSHRFVVTGREQASVQPVAATDSCAFCHGEFLPNP